MFTRQATGLVREVSPVSQTIFNILPAVPGVVLAISVFWILAAFPGANIFAAFWLVSLIAILFALTFGFLSTAMPRSGGDYILVGRSLHPALGLASSLTLFLASMVSLAFVAIATVSVGIAPLLSIIGTVSGQSSWTSAATTISSQGWTLAISLVIVLVAVVLNGIGMRRTMRAQNVLFGLATLGLVVSYAVMLFVPQSDFISAFNQYAQPLTNNPDSYHHVLDVAVKNGVAVSPAASSANLIPAIGALATVMIYSWWSVHFAGESRGARTWRQPATMVGSVIIYAAVLSLGAALFFKMAGSDFVTAMNGLNGTTDYPLAAPPYFIYFAAIASKSAALAVFLAITFLAWFPLWAFIQLLQPMRALFAWSFDGVMPTRLAAVNERTHMPLVALAVCSVFAVAATIWAVYSSNFFTVLSTAALLAFPAIFLVSLSAIVLPYRRPDILRGTPGMIRVAGIPILSVLGGLSTIAILFLAWTLVTYTGLGIQPNPRPTIIVTLAIPVAGAVLYFIATAIRRSQGVDITLATKEIPPE
jgi:amino acid transporter